MMQIYAFANQKGGVGKTTTVVNLAAMMAAWGKRVLLVDIDPQSNATTSLGLDPRAISTSIYEVLSAQQPVADTILATRWPGLDILPSTSGLAGATVELNQIPDPRERALRLKTMLVTIVGYDYLLLDSPPSLGILTVNALSAAHGVVVPVQCEYLALEGLSQLMRTIALVRRGLNPELLVRGLVLTMYDARTTLAHQVSDEVRAHFGKQVFQTVVPRSVRLSEAPSYGEPGVFYAPHSSGAVAYRALAAELLQGDGHTPPWPPSDLDLTT
ncbi:MAG: ParA family protein [Anaerolineae bacterium]|nr:ParA family protein [Anaerolineae bacterium]